MIHEITRTYANKNWFEFDTVSAVGFTAPRSVREFDFGLPILHDAFELS